MTVNGFMRWRVQAAVILAGGLAPGCMLESDKDEAPPVLARTEQRVTQPTSDFPATYARQWMTNLANSVRWDTIHPAVAARTYSYGAVGVYEAVVHGMPGKRSLAGQLNGLDALPTPDPALEYDWPTVLAQTMHVFVMNSAYVFPNRVFFEFTTFTQASLQALGPIQIGFRRAAGVPVGVIENSIAFGSALGSALSAWADADGYRALRYEGFIPPVGPQYWVPTGFSDFDKVHIPEEPHFGEVRPLVMTSTDECAPPPPTPFSTEPGSAFYAQAKAVYDAEVNLTDEQRENARFWADGPGATPTPAGHWLALATKTLRSRNLADAALGYAFTSLGYLDSFIAIWQSKYQYNVLRPETYIRRHIDPGWQTFLPTPFFPEYVSGHSGVSGASGTLFDTLFGAGPVVDDTKLRRGFAARSFANYTEAAREAMVSRLYGGIHYPMSNENGFALGQCVAARIVERIHL
ncbi:MAG TPA: vanadium-dependent haloperoxidase [Polyangiaceae bacterium]